MICVFIGFGATAQISPTQAAIVKIGPPCEFVYSIDQVNEHRDHYDGDGVSLDLGAPGVIPIGSNDQPLTYQQCSSYRAIAAISGTVELQTFGENTRLRIIPDSGSIVEYWHMDFYAEVNDGSGNIVRAIDLDGEHVDIKQVIGRISNQGVPEQNGIKPEHLHINVRNGETALTYEEWKFAPYNEVEPPPATKFIRASAWGDIEGNGDSSGVSVSSDGRYIAFTSFADNLVEGEDDTNNASDVFIKDTETGNISRVSKAWNGDQGNNHSRTPSISGDGRYVAFESYADNLVAENDTNNRMDIFVRDTVDNTTIRVSIASDGEQGNKDSNDPDISEDGRYVVFETLATNFLDVYFNNNLQHVYRHDLTTGNTECVSLRTDNTYPGNKFDINPSISSDGRYVAFESFSNNLVENDINSRTDVFVRDMTNQTTTLVSKASDGSQGDDESNNPSISGDGSKIAFASKASNFWPNDTNTYKHDVFIHYTGSGNTTCLSLNTQGDPAGASYHPDISSDGRYVAFQSYSDDIKAEDDNGFADVFLYNLDAGPVELITIFDDGNQPNNHTYEPKLSSDGVFLAFSSRADNIVSEDNNGVLDAFYVQTQETGSGNAGITLQEAISSIPDGGFVKNPTQRRAALSNKINAYEKQLETGNMTGAQNKLENDILKHVEGWIKDKYPTSEDELTKEEVLEIIDALIESLDS